MPTMILGERAKASSLALETRQASQILNDFEEGPITYGLSQQALAYQTDFPKCIHRMDTITITFNCHGLTFGSRRTQIRFTSEVSKIIAEDGYSKIERLSEVAPGDVVLWVSEFGDYEHSGIVINIMDTQPPVPIAISKWGRCQEVIHPVNSSPYGGRTEFYRIKS